MKLILFICLLLSFKAYSSVEVLIGLNAGYLDFESTVESSDKDEFTSFNTGFLTQIRANATLANINIGAVAYSTWNDMNLLKNSNSGSDSTYHHVFYGPHLGIGISNTFRLNFEYYLKSTHEVIWAEPKGANPFEKGDRFEGKGYGVGVSKLNGKMIIEIMYKTFIPEKSFLDNVEYKSDEEVQDFEIRSISISGGILF